MNAHETPVLSAYDEDEYRQAATATIRSYAAYETWSALGHMAHERGLQAIRQSDVASMERWTTVYEFARGRKNAALARAHKDRNAQMEIELRSGRRVSAAHVSELAATMEQA